MCTSFISSKNNVIIGMNFDNNGMAYFIDTKIYNWFVVTVDGGRVTVWSPYKESAYY